MLDTQQNLVFKAVSDPSRRFMLDAMRSDEKSVRDLTDMLGVAQPTVSKHLVVLREAGLVSSRAEGRNRLYSIHPDGLLPVLDWLSHYQQFWDDRLRGLETFLDRQAQAKSSKTGEAS